MVDILSRVALQSCKDEFDRPVWNIWAMRRTFNAPWYQFSRGQGGERELTLLCVSVWGVWCLGLIVPTFLRKLLGNRNGHRPGFLSGKWNPESVSQTSNHTFILLIHSLSGVLPEAPEGGEQKWIEVCMLGNQHVYS